MAERCIDFSPEGPAAPQFHLLPRGTGWIEVITGSMFSGKTEELLRRMKRAVIARQSTLIVKPALDTRYSKDHVVSHDRAKLPSIPIKDPEEIFELARNVSVIGIDEAQFFPPNLVEVCERLAAGGKRVIVVGLDQDYLGRPFHPIPELVAVAEYVTKLLAICSRCGNPAIRNQRLVPLEGQVVLGSYDAYEARCRKCFEPNASA